MTNDEKLLADHVSGVEGSFETLVQRYSRELYHFVMRFMSNSAAAEDVVQETFLQVYLSSESFDAQRRFKPWLFTIAANKARDALRSRARRPESPLDAGFNENSDERGSFRDLLADDSALPDEVLDASEQQELVREVVQQMPPNLREVLVLAYFHQFPYKQIAEMLGIPLGTVKSRLHTAVAWFGDAFRTAINKKQ